MDSVTSHEGLSQTALRILAELPFSVRDAARGHLLYDADPDIDALAEQIAAAMNEGQRWALAVSAVRDDLIQQRRTIMRNREKAARQPRKPPATQRYGWGEKKAAEKADRAARAARVGLPPDATNLQIEWAKAEAFFADWEAQITLDVTAELLASSFALGDGTSVTWGTASADDHRQRAQMLERQGMGTLETAMMHRAAARDISAAGVDTLAALAGKAAA